MATRIEQLRNENKNIENRYERVKRAGSIKDMYTARMDYQDRIDQQREELSKMDANSPEYKQAKADIEAQQTKADAMGYHAKEGSSIPPLEQELEGLKRENRALTMEMDQAIQKGNTGKFDELSYKYSNNLKAQEGIGADLKKNGIEYEDTVERQKIVKRNLDMDMRDKMEQKMQQDQAKGKQPNAKDMAAYEKYADISRQEEREALEEIDNRKIKQMEAYGVSPELIQREKQEMEQARNRLLGHDKK